MNAPPPLPSCPWLVYYHGEEQTFCCNISESESEQPQIYRQRIPAALHNKKVLSCSYGWIVLYDDDANLLSLCNSTTFDTVINLPILELSRHNKIDKCILSSSPNKNPDNSCNVLLFLKNIPSIMRCGLRDDDEWSEIRYEEQLNALNLRKGDEKEEAILYFQEPIACGDKIYALLPLGRCELWSIEIVEVPLGLVLSCREFNWGWTHRHSPCLNEFLVESCSDLFLIYLIWGGVGYKEILVVEVSRLNFDTMVWERVERIRDQSFFICDDYCFSCPVFGPGYVYFTKNEDPSLYRYDIENESVLVSVPCPDLPTPWLRSIWVMPQVLKRPTDCCEKLILKGHNDTLDLQGTSQEDMGKKKNGSSSSDGKNQLHDLPFDLMLEIIEHLKVFDYMNFRSVCRIFQSVAPAVNWRIALSGSKINLSFPLLMFTNKGQGLHKFVDSTLNHQSYLMRIPNVLEDTIVRYSNYGWLLMSRNRDVHLYNPLTRDIISYVDVGHPRESFFFASKPSSSSGCLLVSVVFYIKTTIVVSVRLPGRNEWASYRLESKSDFNTTHTSPVLFQDAFYYLGSSGNLGKLQVDEESVSWQVLDQPTSPCSDFHQNFLVECGGELLSVFIGFVGKWVLVYKLNQSENNWESVTSLSNYALYLSRHSSFSMVATSPGAQNKIYIPGFRGGGYDEIVYYSLDTGKWHSVGSQHSSSDLYGNRLMLNSCWIKPSWF